MLSSDYPYESREQACKATSESSFYAKTDTDRSYLLGLSSNDYLKGMVLGGVPTVAVASTESAFRYYKSGVVTTGCRSDGEGLDHAVAVVGYGVETDPETAEEHPFFLIKNSWGSD